jgi:hypothetical protein
MRPLLAAVLLVGLSVAIAAADDKPTPPPSEPSTVAPDQDVRLACLTNAKPQKIGVLTYYTNKGGGYTFIEGKDIVFYALPYRPTMSRVFIVGVYQNDIAALVARGRFEAMMTSGRVKARALSIIGTAQMPPGAQTFYRGDMRKTTFPDALLREDTPIAKWSRDSPADNGRLSIMANDSETRLKLKSIVPVLERAEHAR